ncbi:hypothetical protein [Sporomusa sp.]|uniref:hypothetical protein n=1 Tax=Sporomusa sp. TaxID=2078658 RepID=UPI002B98F8CD|nr:hypothetical protein [Sporomusa sp.]HWR44922.1 hypothetical protein [Sporomusa sp.]
MSVNNINISNIAPVLPVKTEAADSLAVNQDTAGEVRQNASGQMSAPAQAALLALESFITTGLAELGQTLDSRTTLVNSLPPDVKELVTDILHQTQAAQTVVPDGLTSLLKSPRTAVEKLTILAAVLEKAAASAGEEVATPAGAPASKLQPLTELISAWRDINPDDLKAAAKVLRELVAAVVPKPESASAGRPEVPAAVFQSSQLVGEPQNTTEVPVQTKVLPGEPEDQAPSAVKPNVRDAGPDRLAAAPLPGSTPRQLKDIPVMSNLDVIEQQDVPTLLKADLSQGEPEDQAPSAVKPNVRDAGPDRLPAAPLPGSTPQQLKDILAMSNMPDLDVIEQQDVPTLLKAVLSRPEIVNSLPTEIREFIQTLLRQEVPPQTGQAAQQALPEDLAAFVKSTQPATEKLAVFVAALEQVAESFSPEGRPTAKAVPGTQLGLIESASAWQGKNPEELKTSANIIRGLAETMPKPGGVLAERQDSQSVLTFTVPLYFGDGQTAYPAHIHVFHQEQEDKKNPGQTVTETWLRICLETENIGVVETAFRLYDGHTVDVKVRFADKAAADGFADDVDEVKEKLGQLPLTLGEFLVK